MKALWMVSFMIVTCISGIINRIYMDGFDQSGSCDAQHTCIEFHIHQDTCKASIYLCILQIEITADVMDSFCLNMNTIYILFPRTISKYWLKIIRNKSIKMKNCKLNPPSTQSSVWNGWSLMSAQLSPALYHPNINWMRIWSPNI